MRQKKKKRRRRRRRLPLVLSPQLSQHTEEGREVSDVMFLCYLAGYI
jgi:hypothetical protein